MSALLNYQQIFVQNFGKLIDFAYQRGFRMTAGEWARTEEIQKIYVASGRSKTMESRHIVRLAGDVNIFFGDQMLFAPGISTEQYLKDIETARPLGSFWMALHPSNVWGGDWNRNGIYDETFKDPYHFEMKPPQ